MKRFEKAAAAMLLGAMTATASAVPITLTFEGVGSQASVNQYYNGGTDSQGHSGTNFGVGFGANALALAETDPDANFSGEPAPGNTVLFFSTGSAVLNYAPGFDTGFSFYYSTVSFAGSVRVYDGVNATGNLLGSITVPALGAGPDPANAFSNWRTGSLAFGGLARSIDFGGTVNQVGYDNITFGSVSPVIAVPEPQTWALMVGGLAFAAASRRRVGGRRATEAGHRPAINRASNPRG